MNRAVILAAILFLTCVALPATCLAWDLRGPWVAQQMGTRLEATVEQNGNAVSGVAFLYSRGGKKDTYHFNGSIQGNKVTAYHSDGHLFSGQILDSRHVKGMLRTKGGHKIPVEATRR